MKRYRALNDHPYQAGMIVYYMSRDQRVADNPALYFAYELALKHKQPLAVVFCLMPKFLNASLDHYHFMLEGLKEVESELHTLGIPFYLLQGQPDDQIVDFVKTHAVGALIKDFSPLRHHKTLNKTLAQRLVIPLIEVDAHNVVPAFFVSNKAEFGAYTLRPKIHKRLPEYLIELPQIGSMGEPIVKDSVFESAYPLPFLYVSGSKAAQNQLNHFIEHKLPDYANDRNDPNKGKTSELSVYLHFGQISAQRVALSVMASEVSQENKDAFLEELIVRKELADNYCLYEENYDNFEGLHPWAKTTLTFHEHDSRDYLYPIEAFEQAKTHDPLWNAAQIELLNRGSIHGYMRMYWGKKILEWTRSPQEAIQIAIYLNDTYALDGRDPNGYVGILWCIGGLHDRAWAERNTYGKIRYMNASGASRKFDVNHYINTWVK